MKKPLTGSTYVLSFSLVRIQGKDVMTNRFSSKVFASFKVVQNDRTQAALTNRHTLGQIVTPIIELGSSTARITTNKELRYQVRVADIMKRLQLGV